jgi:hypothetical protein
MRLVGHGPLFNLKHSHRPTGQFRTEPYEIGYAPLGLQPGLTKEESQMTLLWQELQKRNIPLSVVVYPWPTQIAHDTMDSKQVLMWRDWCARKCKSFISIFPAFCAVKNQCPKGEPGCWYLNELKFGDEQYSAAGNALVADAVGTSFEEARPVRRN